MKFRLAETSSRHAANWRTSTTVEILLSYPYLLLWMSPTLYFTALAECSYFEHLGDLCILLSKSTPFLKLPVCFLCQLHCRILFTAATPTLSSEERTNV
jgi:hypothetical protein